MLLKENRLRRKKDFEILFKEGRFLAGNLVDCKFWFVNPEKYPKRGYTKSDLKIGFIVTKKIHKSAVMRNRLKRQMREAVRLLIKDGKIKTGAMIVIMAKPKMSGADFGDISNDILVVLKRAGVTNA